MTIFKSLVLFGVIIMFGSVQADTIPSKEPGADKGKLNESANPGAVTDADGNIYTTVTIGNQVWTVENLRTTKFNDNSEIPNVKEKAAWAALGTPGYCYYDNTKSIKDGALYNWYAVNTGKLAPQGWHVPTIAEWDTLRNYLIKNSQKWAGTPVGNKIGKLLAAKTNWFPSKKTETIGNDMSKNDGTGFSAFPAGYRPYDGVFYDGRSTDKMGGLCSYWWSSSEVGTTDAFGSFLDYDYEGTLGTSTLSKNSGFSVRLVKD